MAEVDAMETEIKQIRATLGQLQKDIDGLIKTVQTKTDKSKCFATNVGKVSGELDIHDFRFAIFPKPRPQTSPSPMAGTPSTTPKPSSPSGGSSPLCRARLRPSSRRMKKCKMIICATPE